MTRQTAYDMETAAVVSDQLRLPSLTCSVDVIARLNLQSYLEYEIRGMREGKQPVHLPRQYKHPETSAWWEARIRHLLLSGWFFS